MAFRGSTYSNTPTSASNMYTAGQKTQMTFQCGWDSSKYLATPQTQQSWGTRSFSSVPLQISRTGQSSLTTVPTPSQQQQTKSVPNAAPDRSALSQNSSSSTNQPQYFMAGRRGCGFVQRAMQAHTQLNLQNVTSLMCDTPQHAQHPVCRETIQKRRGTPSYYKQTGPNQYQFVTSGFNKSNPAHFMN